MGKKYMRMKGGNGHKGFNAINVMINNQKIIIIPTTHDRLDITNENLEKITNKADELPNLCYLVESDYRFRKNDIKKLKHGDFTTKRILKFLKEKYQRERYNNICVKGWDIRQSLISQKYQNKLYHSPLNLSLGEISKNYIKKFPIRKGKNKYLNKEYEKLINTQIKECALEIIINKIKTVQGEKFKWEPITMKQLYTDKNIKTNLDDLIYNLQVFFAKYSDLYILEKILDKDNNSNYVIFVGANHFNNLKKHLQNLNIL